MDLEENLVLVKRDEAPGFHSRTLVEMLPTWVIGMRIVFGNVEKCRNGKFDRISRG